MQAEQGDEAGSSGRDASEKFVDNLINVTQGTSEGNTLKEIRRQTGAVAVN
jgi:hypothetical protein